MANTDKNILITPNTGSSTSDPQVVFTCADTTASDTITLSGNYVSNGVLSFEGSAGQLFSVSNDLTGTIFSVNDVSGIPSIEVDADGTVSLVEFGGNVGIGTSTPEFNEGYKTLAINSNENGGVLSFFKNNVRQSLIFNDGTGSFYIYGDDVAGSTLRFLTKATERMRIDSAGSLIVAGDTSYYSGTKITTGNTSAFEAGLNIINSSGGIGHILFGDGSGASAYRGQISYNHNGDSLFMYTGGASRMSVQSGGVSVLNAQNTINATTPGVSNAYGLHFEGATTNDYATGITFAGAGTTATLAQSGIYVQSSPSYGTKMYLATTDNYSTGAKTALEISHTGVVNMVRATPTVQGNTIWHAGNDGDGTGLDADLLDGIQATSFLRSDTSDTFSGGGLTVNSATGVDITNTGGIDGLQIFQPTAQADALITFHVSNDFALHFGLDGDTNDLAVGGWSMGANKYKIWHAGNHGSGSGLDADLLDGNHSSAFHTAGNPVFSGDATNKDDITTRTESGFYETSTATTAEGWPTTTNGWHHLIACTHSNDANYYSMQLSSSFYDQNLFFRATNGSGTTAWSKIWSSSNHGSGSGLDADTLDGVQGSAFVYDKGTAPTDLNTAGMGVWRMNTGHTPQPAGTAYGTLVSFDNVNDTGFQLASDYSGLTFYWRSSNAPVYGGVGSFSEWNKISTVRSTTTATSKTLTSGEHCTVTAAGQTITLPANPSAGMEVFISVGNFTNTIVGRNNQNIMGIGENMTIDSPYVGLTFTFSGDATQGWRIS